MPKNKAKIRAELAEKTAEFERTKKITIVPPQVRTPTPFDMRTFRVKDVALQKWEGEQ